MSWKRACILSVTGTEVDGTWATESLRCPSFTPGIGVQHVPTPTRIEPDGKYTYEGEELFRLLLWHNFLILQHIPPYGFIKDLLKAKGSQIEEVALWIDYESTVAAGYWSKYQKPLEVIQRGFTLRAKDNKLNRFGNALVDPYEGYGNLQNPDDWKVRESKHSWFMDLERTEYPVHFIAVLGDILSNYPGIRVFTDNCYSWQYPGTATNVTQSEMLMKSSNFIKGMKEYLSYLRKLGRGIWGNCSFTDHYYPELDLKMGELDLVNSSDPLYIRDQITASIDRAEHDRRGLKQFYIMHCEPRGQGVRWSRDASLWRVLDQNLDNVYQDNIGVITARSSRYLMCPERCY